MDDVSWVRWGARFTVTPAETKTDVIAPGGEWQARDWQGQWIRMGSRVQVRGRNRSGTVTGADRRRGVTVAWDGGGESTLAPGLLSALIAPGRPPRGGRAAGPAGRGPGGHGRGGPPPPPPPPPPSPPPGGGSGPRPKVRDLIPIAGQPWDKDAAESGARQLLEGRDFGGYRIELVDYSGKSLPGGDSYVHWTAAIRKDGETVGTLMRRWNRDADGTLSAYNDYQVLDAEERGNGFAPLSGRYLEQLYIESDFDRVDVYASKTDGGYTWASAAFDFAYEHEAEERLYALQAEMDDLERERDQWEGPREDPRFERIVAELAAAEQIMERWGRFDFGNPGYPTARDISQTGRRPGENIRDHTWIGLRAMRGSSWDGVKKLK